MTIICAALRALLVGTGLSVSIATFGAYAQSPDWPCVQRLVRRLEPGQMWSGPPPAAVDMPRLDVQTLAHKLIDPKLPPESLGAEVKSFRDGLPDSERNEALRQLFAVSLDWLNDERGALIRGIERYARGQRSLADRIVAETRELEKLQAASADPAQIEQLQSTQAWDTRIYTDRQKSLTLVCDQPVELEQRAFALARIIQENLP
jgi:hypothetical protein